ncbi:helix-turn-helix transcriptional regulator [Longitalea luteola]|uniref:helix-turn-helix transcriptional regulator n=1 Tax=Longitalea luteola TaxID=2812563 RepID=UPI001A9680EC|nr:helix-turn-helix transcriptional regulator [Longitalea luteola]
MLHNDQIRLIYNALGLRIKEEREKANYKQTTFASLLQISRASLVNIEKGRQRAPIHVVYEISRLLKLPITDLLPDLNKIMDTEVNKSIQQKIEKKSAGNQDLQQKLMEFVKSHTNPVKTSI